MKILLVDDDPFVLKLLERQLANLEVDFEVVSCNRAKEALELLEGGNHVYTLVFLDLQMPEMDGVEFLRELGKISFSGGLVLLTGEEKNILQTAERLATAHNLNVCGTLHKPVYPEQLQQIVIGFKPRNTSTPSRKRKSYTAEELQRAITCGELVNHYQPKVAVAGRKVVGVETLVRWQHPEDGMVFPDQFIGLAEDSDLINELTWSVLTNALCQASLWQNKGLDLQVAVNISMDNLTSLDFPEFVLGKLTDYGVAARSLVLEVTESRLMRDPLSALDILTRLRLKQVGLSIDDFGTGNSSLTQLHDIPFNELKIDRGFVHGACRSESLRAIFHSSLDMAQQLGMKVVAEGVEDEDDWDFLHDEGCNVAQGYFIAKPMPAENIPAWITEWQERQG